MCQTSKTDPWIYLFPKIKCWQHTFDKCSLSWGIWRVPATPTFSRCGQLARNQIVYVVAFFEHVTVRAGLFFMLNKSTRQNNLPFFLNVILHKRDDEKKCYFPKIQMKMKLSHSFHDQSGHKQLLHHLHHCKSVKPEKCLDRRQRYVFICHMAAVDSWVWTIHSKTPYLKNAMRDFLFLEDEVALQLKGQRPRSLHPHGRHAYECRIVVRNLFWWTKIEDGLVSFCRFMFHFKAISKCESYFEE